MPELSCDLCGEAIEEEPLRRGSRVYCSEACAFEATRSRDCAGRRDSVMREGTAQAGFPSNTKGGPVE
ncbi:MAG: hypothetical protein PVI07_14975 [Anaerolineae bacterium]|jgi:hypothetical protein